jgi:tripartite-type tricarboxylate transporter receptor subunit TctC
MTHEENYMSRKSLQSAMPAVSASTRLRLVKRIVAVMLMLGCLTRADYPAAAQTPSKDGSATYPDRPIHIIVPFAPGGASDVLARVVGDKLSEAWGQPVVIDNRPGAGGNLGAEMASKASPDGYTMLLVADAVRAPTLNYNIVDDFAPITLGTVTPMIVVVPPTLPVNTIQELLTLAKQQQLFFGSGGVGSSTEVAGLVFAAMGQVHLEEVTYKSIPPVVPDLLAGRLSVAFLPVQLAGPLVSSGKLKGLAVTSAARSSAWPDLPTVAEAGIPGYEHVTWGGFLVPAGTPKSIVTKLNTEIVRALSLPDVNTKLTGGGSSVVANTPEEFDKFLKQDVEKQHELVKKYGLQFN